MEIRQQMIHEVSGVFDVVMFSHSFEHLWEPGEALKYARRLLADDGVCIIRIPVIPCAAWERYGVRWVQIDAPRHFYVHSVKGLTFLADEMGFEVENVVYDSTSFQFWGSEQYEKDVALQDPRSFFVNPLKSKFSFRQILAFSREARRLNAGGRGDQASFYLKKKGRVI